MLSFVITDRRNQQVNQMLAFKGGAETIEFDLKPWQVNNGTVTVAAWTVKSGNAGISNTSLSNSIASALITTTDPGRSVIELKLTAGNNINIMNLNIFAKDPLNRINDYGLCQCG